MKESMQREAARQFVADWTDHGYEKGETQKFWLELLGKVLGVSDPYRFIEFEERVMVDTTSFMDAYIPSTRVLIEQKSSRKDLREATRQSDGSMLTPFQQARKYISGLPYSRYPRWMVTCNFRSMLIYDMENPHSEPYELMLDRLEEEYYRLSFLVDDGSDHLRHEEEISLQAGEIVGRIYDLLLTRYLDPDNAESLRSLNVLCTRLVFCLYAEDAGIFGRRGMFYDYLSRFKAGEGDMRRALIELFDVLNTPVEERDPYLRDDLAAFPYVNGGLFEDDHIEIPRFTPEIADLLLNRASLDVDWRHISPTIFGAVFESTLNPETRRSGGMHYTSVKNIHKVIDPLFLDDLRGRLTDIKGEPNARRREAKLRAFQDELAELRFFDPACGSGNFLTETYLSLRRLENEVIRSLYGGQALLGGDFSPIKVSINQMYGIEINDFAVTVAATALWIAEAQMIIETESIVQADLDFLPLKSYSHIVEANALRIDWETVVPKDQLNYIMGNPPFVGKKEQTKTQKEELMALFPKVRGAGNLDYVSGWYIKAIELMQGTQIQAAFVSTNSITQGEQVPVLWNTLLNKGIEIEFAYRTFKWVSEAQDMAAVHCVIIGFSTTHTSKSKRLFNGDEVSFVNNINPYLVDGPSVLIQTRTKSISNAPTIMYGSMPIDDGHLVLEAKDVDALLAENPENIKFIRKYAGGAEIIHGKDRWCLWLKNISPREMRESKFVMGRIKATEEFRRSSKRPQTIALADIPYLFGEIRQPNTTMLVLPKVSSETRSYIPIAFVQPEIIISGSALIVPEASLYTFGILTSNVHMAWMRAVCGRLEMRYHYSANIVYNNFPWPTPTPDQQTCIEQTAQAILDARALYPDSSLADLYDEVTMPIELRRDHQANDHAVLDAYTLHHATPESDIVAHLLRLYQQLTT